MSNTETNQHERAQMFVDRAKEYKDYVEKRSLDLDRELDLYIAKTGSPSAGLDVLMYNNAEFRAAFNALPENREDSNLRVSYDVTAKITEDTRYMEEDQKFSRQLDTASAPGGANLVQVSLADSIIHKAETTGQVIDALAKDVIPFGNKEYPRITAKAVGAFVAEQSELTDITASTYEVATNGITKVLFTPRDFGLRASYTQRLLRKVSPQSVAFFREYEAKGLTRGIEQQALRGDGSGQNATGITGVATAVPFSGNAYLTFNDAVGVLGAADTDNIVAMMHRKTWQEIKKLRVINESYRQSIDPVNVRIDDIPVIITNNADASVATTGTVILGDFSHYLYARTGGLETIEDKFTNAATRVVNVYHTMMIDLGALIPASFATFNVTF